jgi:hypothetical protein
MVRSPHRVKLGFASLALLRAIGAAVTYRRSRDDPIVPA